MIQIYVKLTVKSFDCLEQFERQAVALMQKYQGVVIAAFETVHNTDGTGEEIHILQFPSPLLLGITLQCSVACSLA